MISGGASRGSLLSVLACLGLSLGTGCTIDSLAEIRLDLDPDEDGVPDAASFSLRSAPSRIEREEVYY